MTRLDLSPKDLLTALLLIGIGSFLAYNSITELRLGTLSAMGPGAFPAGIGVLLVLLGLAVGIGAMSDTITLDLRAAGFILGAIAAFAVLARPFGLVPATVVCSLIACGSARGLKIGPALAATLVVTALTVGIFTFGLGLPLALFRWPFP